MQTPTPTAAAGQPAHKAAAALQRIECASWRGHRLTGLAHHAGAAQAYRHAVLLLAQQIPGVLDAAIEVLDADIDAHLRADYRQLLAAQRAQLTVQPADADLGLPAVQQLNHGQPAVSAPHGQEPVSPVPAHHQP